MSRKVRFGLLTLVVLGIVAAAVAYFSNHNVDVLSPQGPIGHKERNLIILAVALSAIVVIPVYIMLIGFAWRYREGNKKARYDPQFNHNRLIESVWWGVPLAIITILGIATWRSSHELDPFKPLVSNAQPMTIQVIALDWKWLFIYPQQNVASVNYVQFPKNVPVDFQITADAPMNSFWIPALGGQIYAMSGMATNLHLLAEKEGTYHGSSANISGSGFAGMDFTARSSSWEDFYKWVDGAKKSATSLSLNAYNSLARPSKDNPVTYYSSVEKGLFNKVVFKFTQPSQLLAEGS